MLFSLWDRVKPLMRSFIYIYIYHDENPSTFVRVIQKIGEKPSTERGRNQTGNRDNRRILFSSGVLCFRVSSIKLQRLLARFPRQVEAISFLGPEENKFLPTYLPTRPSVRPSVRPLDRRGNSVAREAVRVEGRKKNRTARILKHGLRVDVESSAR